MSRTIRGFVTSMILWAQHIIQSPYIKSAEYQTSIFRWLYGVTGIISELIFRYQSLSAERDIDGSTRYLFWKSWLFITSERRQGMGKGRVCGRMCKVDLTHSGKHDCVQERILVSWEKQKCWSAICTNHQFHQQMVLLYLPLDLLNLFQVKYFQIN